MVQVLQFVQMTLNQASKLVLSAHVPLTDKVNGFAKAGWGNDIKQTYQVGAQYEVRPDVDLNVYYGYDKYSVNSNDKTAKGLHAGVGYSF